MNPVVTILRSYLPNTPPLPGSLADGQLAVNMADKTIFIGDNTGNVITLNDTVLVGDVVGNTDANMLSPSGVTAGTYTKVTVDSKGRVTVGSSPSTLLGYGITDALPLSGGQMTGNIVMLNSTVTNVPTPVGTSDAVNKGYVDGLVADVVNGFTWHTEAMAATTGNIALTGLQVIDTYQTLAGDRIIVKDQTDGTQNGIYSASAGTWVRTADATTGAQLLDLALLSIQGNVNKLSQFITTNEGPIVVGTTAITFGRLQGNNTAYTAGTGLDLTGTVFSVAATGVTPGTYNSITVNAQGQTVSATNTVTTLTGDVTGTADANDTVATVLANSGVTAGTYSKVTVDSKGRVTVGSNLNGGDITAALGFVPYNGTLNPLGFLTALPDILLGGDATGGNSAGFPNQITVNLKASGVVPTIYGSNNTIPVITVGADGRITNAVNQSLALPVSPFSTTQIFNGNATVPALKTVNAVEAAHIVATPIAAVQPFFLSNGAVQYYTSAATTNWTINFTWSSGTPMNTALAVGDSVTTAFLATIGTVSFFCGNIQVDGATVVPNWQGGIAPTTGNAGGIDVYTFTIIKTAASTYTVLAAQTQY